MKMTDTTKPTPLRSADPKETKAREAALEAARLYKPEKRPFWSHVTLARVRSERASGRRRGGRPMAVSDPLPALPDELLEPFGCVRLTLYRSILRPQGAEYVPLASLDLPSRDTTGTKKE